MNDDDWLYDPFGDWRGNPRKALRDIGLAALGFMMLLAIVGLIYGASLLACFLIPFPLGCR